MRDNNVMKSVCPVIGLCFVLLASTVHPVCAGPIRIQVDAGAYDRQNTIVGFQLPMYLEPGTYILIRDDGSETPLQIDHQNRGWFILGALAAGTSAWFDLGETSRITQELSPDPAIRTGMPEYSGVSLQMDTAVLSLSTKAGTVLSYYHGYNEPPGELDERYRRGGYIHPVYSPSGQVLTNHLNPAQHPHHAGIWSAWTNTIFEGRSPDFWNVHQNSGRVDVDSLIHFWDGPVTGGLVSRHQFIDLSGEEPVVALNESWEVRVYSIPDGDDIHIFDLTVTQTVNTGRPLKLPEYRYGGIGFRGHSDWDDPDKCFFLTSGGLGRDGHATRARWAHMGGYTAERLAGFAILGHPSNYRFPQPMRIHPSEPFFNFAPAQLGDMEITPGVPHVTKLRIVTHDGEPDSSLIDRYWYDFAYPPGVSIID
jgi:hypothetical protein